MEIITFKFDMQQSVDAFFEKCFTAVGIPYSPMDRHADVADVEQYYMRNGCFYTITSNDGSLQGVIKEIDDGGMVIERNSGERETVNLDFVTRIREYPRKKNGKKKGVVLD